MGFFDALFGGGDKGGSSKGQNKGIDKLVVRLRERYAQPEYRREAMEKLLAMGTPEALAGVLQRFTIVAQSPHWDEEEKRWLVDELAQRGEPAKEALRIFLKSADHIAFASKALARLSSKDEFLADLITSLHARPPEDHRTVQGKAELVAALAEFGDARAVAAILPYTDDHADDVQCTTVDALEKLWSAAGGEQESAEKKLQAVIVNDARSARVLRHTAAAMARLSIAIDPTRPLAPAVAEDFVVKDGKLARPG
jgi:hypothetical protein